MRASQGRFGGAGRTSMCWNVPAGDSWDLRAGTGGANASNMWLSDVPPVRLSATTPTISAISSRASRKFRRGTSCQ